MQETLVLNIDLHDDVDQPALERLTSQLLDEISDLDVDYAKLASASEVPLGAKGDPITVGSIMVALASAGVFTGLIETLKSWALRHEGRSVTIKAEVEGRKLEMTFSPAEASEAEMARFAEKIMQTLQPAKKKR
jgi:hypothetical protein